MTSPLNARERVRTALEHRRPDRTPVDFVAVPEIWEQLYRRLQPEIAPYAALADWMEPKRAAVLRALDVDCRLLSYDMFLQPPGRILRPGARVDWWGSAARSTPNRMWRQVDSEGWVRDIWGVTAKRDVTAFGTYENAIQFPLEGAADVAALKAHPWPEPDWWDFSAVPELIDRLVEAEGPTHLRYRVGSVFETAWQLCGMEAFMLDLYEAPEKPLYIMDRLTDVHVENTRRFLERAAGRVDMIYFYDDVATTNSLLMSIEMWERFIRPRHQRIIDVARRFGVKTMLHSDGAVGPLIPQWIEMGIDLLNPIQTDAGGMEPERLKADFGARLSFHGGMSIVRVLPRGTPEEVRAEVRRLVAALGRDGGYILAGTHHIQGDTPVDNILAMYETEPR